MSKQRKKLILPCYGTLYLVFSIIFSILFVGQAITLAWRFSFETQFHSVQFHSLCLLTVYCMAPIILIQNSVSTKFFRRAYNVLIPFWLVGTVFWALSACIKMVGYSIIFLLFSSNPMVLCIGILTKTIRSRIQIQSRSYRCSVDYLLLFTLIFASLNAYHTSICFDERSNYTATIILSITTLFWNAVFPLSLHRSLLADTKFWRGLGHRNQLGIGVSSTSAHDSSLYKPEMDISVAASTLQEMMSIIGNIVVDFAFLDVGGRIGQGATSEVYKGTYKR